jgi:hypothetical protein
MFSAISRYLRRLSRASVSFFYEETRVDGIAEYAVQSHPS